MDQELQGEIELANGEEVTIPRPDKVYPTFGVVDAYLDVSIQQDRIRMTEKGLETEMSLAGPVREITDARPKATLFTGLSRLEQDDIYAEIAFDTLDEIRELRDSLNLLLQYHGADLEDNSEDSA